MSSKQKQFCDNCSKKFGLTRGSKMCKRCNNIFCNDCIDNKKKTIVGLKDTKLHKRCTNCSEDQEQIDIILKEHDLKWGEDSIIGDEWIVSLGIKIKIGDEEEFDKKVRSNDYISSNQYQQLIDILNVEGEIKEQFKKNYSFYEVLSILHNVVAEGDIRQDIKRVCAAFLCDNIRDKGFSRHVFDLSVYLLCFNSAYKAYAILKSLYDNIIPSYMYEVNKTLGFSVKQSQMSNFMSILRNKLLVKSQNLPQIQKFFEYQWMQTLTTFFVTELNFDIVFNMFTHILRSKNQYETFIKIMLSVPKISQKYIKQYGADTSETMSYILAMTKKSQILDNIQYDEEIQQPVMQKDNPHAIKDALLNLENRNKDLEEKNNELQEINEKSQFQIILMGGEIERLTSLQGSNISQNKSQLSQDDTPQRMTMPVSQNTESSLNNNEATVKKKQRKSSGSSVSSSDLEDQRYQELQNKYNTLQKDFYDQKGQYLKLQKNYDDLKSSKEPQIGDGYELKCLQSSYEELEKKFMNSCGRLIMVGAENKRLNNLVRDLEEQLISCKNTQKSSENEKDPIDANIWKVRALQYEREAERTKDSLRKVQKEHKQELERQNEEWKRASDKELKRINEKYEAEKNYFEKEQERQKQLMNDLREKVAFLSAENDRLRKNNNQSSQSNLRESVSNQGLESQLMEKDKKIREIEKQLNQIQNQNSTMSDNLQNQKTKSKRILQQHLMLIIENKRLTNILSEIRDEIKIFKERSQQAAMEKEQFQEDLQQKQIIINQQEEEIKRLNGFMKDKGGQEDLINQMNQLQEEKTNLIQENGKYKLEIEQLKVNKSSQENEIERLKKELKEINEKHRTEIEYIKRDYEEHVIKEIQDNANREINRLKQELAQKEKQYTENIKYYEEQIRDLQRRVSYYEEQIIIIEKKCQQLEKQNKELTEKYEQISDKYSILKTDQDRKERRIKDLENQMQILQEQYDQIKQDVQRRERKVKELEENLKNKEEEYKILLKQKQDKIDALEDKITLLSSELSRYSQQKRDLQRENEQLKEDLQKLEKELKKQQEKYKNTVEQKNEEFDKQVLSHQQEIKKMQKDKKDLQDKLDQKAINEGTDQKQSEQKVKEIEKIIIEKTEYIEVIQSQKNRQDRQIEDQKQQIQDLQEEINRNSEKLAKSEREVKVIERNYSEIKQIQNNQNLEIEKYKDVQQKCFTRLILIISENERLISVNKKQQDKIDSLTKDKKKIEQQIEDLENLNEKQKKEIKKLKEELEDKQMEHKQVVQKKDREIQDIKQEIHEKVVRIEKQEIQIREITHGVDSKQVDELNKVIKNFKDQEDQYLEHIRNLKNQILNLEERIASVASENERLKKRIENYEDEIANKRTEAEIAKNQLKESNNIIEAMKTTLKHKNVSLVEAEGKVEELEGQNNNFKNRFLLLCAENERLTDIIRQKN